MTHRQAKWAPVRRPGGAPKSGKRARLDAEIVAARLAAFGRPFVWGEDDCCLWPANIVRAALGYDPAASWRGRYRSRRGALRVMANRSLIDTVARAGIAHDWTPIAPDRALTGDVGIARLPDGIAGVIRFRSRWLGRRDGGFAVVMTSDVVAAWRI